MVIVLTSWNCLGLSPQYCREVLTPTFQRQASPLPTQLLSNKACRQTGRGKKKKGKEKKAEQNVNLHEAARAVGPQLFVDRQGCRPSGFILLVCDLTLFISFQWRVAVSTFLNVTYIHRVPTFCWSQAYEELCHFVAVEARRSGALGRSQETVLSSLDHLSSWQLPLPYLSMVVRIETALFI